MFVCNKQHIFEEILFWCGLTNFLLQSQLENEKVGYINYQLDL